MASCGNTSGALWIARHSHCPGQKWHDLVAHLRHLDEHGHLDFVNVGANKGYNLVSFCSATLAPALSTARTGTG